MPFSAEKVDWIVWDDPINEKINGESFPTFPKRSSQSLMVHLAWHHHHHHIPGHRHYEDHLTKLLDNFHIAAIKHLKSKRVGTKSSVRHRHILAVSWRGGRDEVSNMILVGWWVVSEDLSTLGWELVVSKDKPPCHTRYSQSFFLMSRPLSRWSGWIRNIFSKCSFISLQSKLKGFYISFFKESTLYVISFSYSSWRKK